jgi:hypothetical protein
METVREKWTDERLDDLKDEVTTLRIEMRDEFRGVRGEIASLREEMHAGFASLQRTMIQFGGLLIAALIGLIATQL